MIRKGCRFCGAELKHTFMDLGHMPPANSLLLPKQLSDPETCYPLKAMVCHHCLLVQVADDVPVASLFNERYPYYSSGSKVWLEHARSYVDMIIPKYLDENSLVCEIGGNDGYLLQYFMELGIDCVNIEPSEEVGRKARDKGIRTITRFFDERLAWELSEKYNPSGGREILRRPDLIICNNVMAHVPNINMFVRGLKVLLADNGVITCEFPHLLKLVEGNQYDTIYHEHFSYFSFGVIRKIFARHDLDIFDVDELPTHGGSLRIYAKHHTTKYAVMPSVNKMWEKEYMAGMTELAYYIKDKLDFRQSRFDLLKMLYDLQTRSELIIASGAAAKGITFLNYCHLDNNTIEYITDNTPCKHGKFTPGSHIRIASEEYMREHNRPRYILILPWNHKDEIIKNLSFVRAWGCKFITAIPKLEVI